MGFYDVEAFSGPENLLIHEPFEVYYSDYIQDNFCYNESYFLLNLKRNRLCRSSA